MKHLDSVKAGLRKKLASLSTETDRIRKVLSALDTYSSTKWKRKNTKEEAKQHRVRRVRYKVKCIRCGNLFTAKATPNGKNPNRIPKFCHKPCNSSLWLREKREKEAKTREKASRRGATLLPGDSLSASVSH